MNRTSKYSKAPTKQLVLKNCLPQGNISSYTVRTGFDTPQTAGRLEAFSFLFLLTKVRKTMAYTKTNNVPVFDNFSKTVYPIHYSIDFNLFHKNIKNQLVFVRKKLKGLDVKTTT